MNIESIDQELIDDIDTVMTRVIINDVTSQCIMTRLLIKALGRPGVDNDMEFLGSGDRWMVLWTQPRMTVDEARERIMMAIEPVDQRSTK